MADAPLIITQEVRDGLQYLRTRAARRTKDITRIARQLATPHGKQLHLREMNRLTTMIPGPWPFFVTLSLESGHPAGTCRHMSMSIARGGGVPGPGAVWIVCEILGFTNGLATCNVWIEDLSDGGKAINVVQPISVQQDAGHA